MFTRCFVRGTSIVPALLSVGTTMPNDAAPSDHA